MKKCIIEGEVVFYNEKGEFEHKPLENVVTTDKEEKVRKNPSKYFNINSNETLVIKSIKTEEKKYEVSVEEFIKVAEKREKEDNVESTEK